MSEQRTISLLMQLRAGTRAAHARMEAHDALSRLLSPDLRVTDYIYALRALHALHSGIAARLASLSVDLPKGFGFDTARLALLNKDLAWFNAAPSRRLGMAGSVNDTESAMGALYVLEGSALGARVIGKAVCASLGVMPAEGGDFFCGATADAARARWAAMSSGINEAGTAMGPQARLRVVKSANATFNALERALRPKTIAGAPIASSTASQSRADPATAPSVPPAVTSQAMN